MCLAIPMKVVKIKNEFAWVKSGGLLRQVNVQMIPALKLGDYVIVHAGFAIEIVDKRAARQTLNLLDEIR